MCGMCGLWGNTDHWSNPAGLPGAVAGAVNVTRARLQQADAVCAFTRSAGATVRDWGQSSWIVETFAGASEIVDSLGAVWAAVERLTGRPVDPLGLDLIQALEARQRP